MSHIILFPIVMVTINPRWLPYSSFHNYITFISDAKFADIITTSIANI